MADKKSDLVDLISDATRQYWRRPAKRAVVEAAPREEKRLSNWPPEHLQQWRLEKLTPGSSVWSEEQSKRNFATVSNLVVPGDPATSRLLLQPLAPEAGGHVFHSGGRQFGTKNDPDWKALVQWINGTK